MKRMMLLGACVLTPLLAFAAQEQPAPISTTTVRQTMARAVNIKIDLLTEEHVQAGLTPDEIKEAIVQQLEEANIAVNDALDQPLLVLRIRTLQVGLDMATFFQLSLLEDAMLIRSRSIFQAATWSQVSLLSCRPEDLKKEILDTVSIMTQAFAKDFAHALQPVGK